MAAGLTVGDFSRATHLSVKTLRHYHQATVFIPVPGPVRPIGRVTLAVIPAAELAVISHHGSLADADLSYAKLGSYAATHEISIDGPLREYYLRGAADTPDEAEWRTEIGWPIFRADTSRP